MIVAANSLSAPVSRVVLAYKARGEQIAKLEGVVSGLNATIDEKMAIIAENEKVIALLKAVLDEVVPEDVGGSTGGVVG